jgi:hypothetical protein
MQPQTQDVEIAGTRYQVGRFKARDGSWILAQVLTKMLPAVIERALVKEAGAKLASNRSLLSEEEFASIQGHALAVCRRYENGVPMPVFVLPNNTFAIKELEYDLIAVMTLTVKALLFNLTPFFEGDGLSQILSALPGLGLGLNSSASLT